MGVPHGPAGRGAPATRRPVQEVLRRLAPR